ncbi:MAG: CDP-alcohol phosphatidyltransferase family protein [Polyangiaceae bacterium]
MGPGIVSLDRRERGSSFFPQSLVKAALALLDRGASRLVSIGVTANAITLASLGIAAVAAVLIAQGRLAWAAPLMTIASVGDALDGLVARRTGTSSPKGALLDASVDRYEEALLLGGIAVLVRDSLWALVATVAALAGSFMVSYGSAKAEALHREVPPGVLRRFERALLLCMGVAATAVTTPIARARGLSHWLGYGPFLVAVVVIAVVGNASAVARLRKLASG